MLKGLRSAQAFAAPLLTEALRQQFGEGLNINTDLYLQGTPVLVIDRRPLGNREWRTDYIKRSLLQAALHNFEASQASVSGAANLNRLERADNSALPVPIRPEQFASLCRSLDLGAKYQAHINAFFNPSANDNETAAQARTRVLANLKGSKRHDLAVAAHMAFIRGQISLAVYQMVLQVTELKLDATLDGYAVYHKRMSILDQPLLDIMLFETWTPTGTFDEFAQRQYRLRKLVIYIPDDPVSPLKEFATWDACESYLCERLGQADYRSFFCRFVMHKDVPRFLAAMELALKEKASLRLGASTISGDPFDDGVRRSLEKVLADARFQAVPTADEDLKTLQENRRAAGPGTTERGGFFCPRAWGVDVWCDGGATAGRGVPRCRGLERWAPPGSACTLDGGGPKRGADCSPRRAGRRQPGRVVAILRWADTRRPGQWATPLVAAGTEPVQSESRHWRRGNHRPERAVQSRRSVSCAHGRTNLSHLVR
jgi:hypothetical protein